MFRTTVLVSLVAALAGTDLAAQTSRNVQLLGRFRPSASFNDVWGYRNPANGKEYALVGSTAGTYIVDVSVPAAPVQRGFISYTQSPGWRACTTRDMKVYKQHAYVTTDCGAGFQIIDLRNPDAPKLVTTWGGQYWRGAHNIAMDTERGVAYPCGSIGFVAVDVNNPTSPKFLTSNRTQGYIHDLSIQSGIAHLCVIFGRRYQLADITKLPTVTLLGSARDAGSIFCHASWPSRDDTVCVTTNERGNGPTGVYDITNKNAPRLLATWHTGGSSTIPHNVIVRDRIAHLSYYIAGGRFVDVSNPSRPTEVGYWDTSSRTSGFNGAWGVYVQPVSGNTYITDRQNGLYILKAKGSVRHYGKSAAGTGGKTPAVRAFGSAYHGNANHKIEIDNAKPNSAGVVLFAFGSGSGTIGGLPINVDLTKLLLLAGFATDGSGKGAIPMPIPSQAPSGTLFVQAFVIDSVGPLGFSATDGMQFELFQK